MKKVIPNVQNNVSPMAEKLLNSSNMEIDALFKEMETSFSGLSDDQVKLSGINTEPISYPMIRKILYLKGYLKLSLIPLLLCFLSLQLYPFLQI